LPAAPHTTLPPAMVGDQGQVVVVLAPRHLVHTDGHQPVQPFGVQLGGHDPFADASDGVPVDTQEPADGGLVRFGGQKPGHVLEVAGEPRPGPGERHGLGHHPTLGAVQPTQLGADGDDGRAEVQMPPRRGDRTPVVAPPGVPAAVRADQPPPAQRHIHRQQARRGQRHATHPHTGQVQQTIQ
jgi:hypothetical protein